MGTPLFCVRGSRRLGSLRSLRSLRRLRSEGDSKFPNLPNLSKFPILSLTCFYFSHRLRGYSPAAISSSIFAISIGLSSL